MSSCVVGDEDGDLELHFRLRLSKPTTLALLISFPPRGTFMLVRRRFRISGLLCGLLSTLQLLTHVPFSHEVNIEGPDRRTKLHVGLKQEGDGLERKI